MTIATLEPHGARSQAAAGRIFLSCDGSGDWTLSGLAGPARRFSDFDTALASAGHVAELEAAPIEIWQAGDYILLPAAGGLAACRRGAERRPGRRAGSRLRHGRAIRQPRRRGNAGGRRAAVLAGGVDVGPCRREPGLETAAALGGGRRCRGVRFVARSRHAVHRRRAARLRRSKHGSRFLTLARKPASAASACFAGSGGASRGEQGARIAVVGAVRVWVIGPMYRLPALKGPRAHVERGADLLLAVRSAGQQRLDG